MIFAGSGVGAALPDPCRARDWTRELLVELLLWSPDPQESGMADDTTVTTARDVPGIAFRVVQRGVAALPRALPRHIQRNPNRRSGRNMDMTPALEAGHQVSWIKRTGNCTQQLPDPQALWGIRPLSGTAPPVTQAPLVDKACRTSAAQDPAGSHETGGGEQHHDDGRWFGCRG